MHDNSGRNLNLLCCSHITYIVLYLPGRTVDNYGIWNDTGNDKGHEDTVNNGNNEVNINYNDDIIR